MSGDSHNLERFVDAQRLVYDMVVEELQAGEKRSHWMWFIFPQVRGLGHSAIADRFAIGSRAEATAYLRHPVLGARIRQCTRLVLNITSRSVDQIFGYPDNLKFRSSMTLFAHVADDADPEFDEALAKYFASQQDQMTVTILADWKD